MTQWFRESAAGSFGNSAAKNNVWLSHYRDRGSSSPLGRRCTTAKLMDANREFSLERDFLHRDKSSSDSELSLVVD